MSKELDFAKTLVCAYWEEIYKHDSNSQEVFDELVRVRLSEPKELVNDYKLIEKTLTKAIEQCAKEEE